jgi:integrase
VPKSTKPKKPRPDFPLFPHATGRWAKKVRGKFEYFGKIADDPQGKLALASWTAQKDDLLAGRKPRKAGEYLSVADLCNRFLNAKRLRVDSREIAVRTWGELYDTCEAVVSEFGKTRAVDDLRQDDFQKLRGTLAKRYGPVRLGNEIQRVRSVFSWGFDEGHIEAPVRIGKDFRRPEKHVIRKNRASRGKRMFEAAACQTLLGAADLQLQAMICLGLNCGLGNNDCGSMREHHVDLKKGWLDYPRPKTGIERRCPLWPETVVAIKAAVAARPKAADRADADRVFLTAAGMPWTADAKLKEDGGSGPRVDCVTQCFRTLLDKTQLHKPGLGFYALRHTFETIAGGTADQVAVDMIMGHADDSMAATYRENVDDKRLRAITDHVHKWLFPTKPKYEPKRKPR